MSPFLPRPSVKYISTNGLAGYPGYLRRLSSLLSRTTRDGSHGDPSVCHNELNETSTLLFSDLGSKRPKYTVIGERSGCSRGGVLRCNRRGPWKVLLIIFKVRTPTTNYLRSTELVTSRWRLDYLSRSFQFYHRVYVSPSGLK